MTALSTNIRSIQDTFIKIICVYSHSEQLCPYNGDKESFILTIKHFTKYFCQIYKDGKLDHYIDGHSVNRSNWMRFVNCATTEAVQTLSAYQYDGAIYYRVTVDVLPDTEMLVWYGEDYAEELGLKEQSPWVQLQGFLIASVVLIIGTRLHSNGGRLCFAAVYFFLSFFFIFFLFTVRSQKLLDRFSPNYQGLCILV